MSTVLNRIHLGIMGDACCHATYGWFCGEIPIEEILTHIHEFVLYITRVISFDMEL